MRVGIMQPYFFPYLGHFALIAACDQWVAFDVTQYTHKSWITRNRVLHPSEGWNYVQVPLANGSVSISIAQARIASFEATRASVLGKLSHYRRQAPRYRAVMELVERGFGTPCEDLVELNLRCLGAVCETLGLPWAPVRASTLGVDTAGIEHAGQWAPRFAARMGAQRYLNPLGGAGLFRAEDFRAAGVEPEFLDFPAPAYETGSYGFVPNLSILDVLMWNPPERVRAMIGQGSRIVTGGDLLH
jgi:hypothetical protein